MTIGPDLVDARVEWDRGAHLAGTLLWFDAARHDVLTAVSCARVDGAWRSARAVCTDRTRALLRTSSPGFSALVAPFGRRLAIGALSVRFFPAGYLPGSSLVFVEAPGGTVLYAGHASLESHALAEPIEVPRARTLVLRTAYGRPEFRFPPRAEALERLVTRARETLAVGDTPVFLGSPMGKAQEIIAALSAAGVPVCVHRTIARVDRTYRNLGFDPGRATTFRGSPRRDSALVFPDRLRSSLAIRGLKRARIFWASGLARVPEAVARMKVDEAIPLAGHLDFDGLVRLVERVDPERTFTVGRWASAFAAHLRACGRAASALHGEEQLTLF